MPVPIKVVRRVKQTAGSLAKLVRWQGAVVQGFVHVDTLGSGLVSDAVGEQEILELVGAEFQRIVSRGECDASDYTLLLYSQAGRGEYDYDERLAVYACVDCGYLGGANDIRHPSVRGELVADPVYGVTG